MPDIRGHVYDASTGKAIEGALVSVDGRSQTRTWTGADGDYHVSEIRKKYVLECISFDGVAGHCPPVGRTRWLVEITHRDFKGASRYVSLSFDPTRSSTNYDGPYVLREVRLFPKTD